VDNAIQNPKRRHGNSFFACALCAVVCALFFMGCATAKSKLPPPPPKYVEHTEDLSARESRNSLWVDHGSLFEDRKALRLNDLVTINIIESLSGSGKADTDTSRESELLYELTNFLGMNNDFNIQNWPILNGMYRGGNVFQPEIASKTTSDFKGKGDTNREGKLVANITAKVVEVQPNGNLVLEARKEITINNETQILVLTGMARPDDVSSDNVIFSNQIADAQVYYVGDGVVQDKQNPGWMVRVLDRVWPF
jgi:flagellar L-ring protein precursor FlgH